MTASSGTPRVRVSGSIQPGLDRLRVYDLHGTSAARGNALARSPPRYAPIGMDRAAAHRQSVLPSVLLLRRTLLWLCDLMRNLRQKRLKKFLPLEAAHERRPSTRTLFPFSRLRAVATPNPAVQASPPRGKGELPRASATHQPLWAISSTATRARPSGMTIFGTGTWSCLGKSTRKP